MYTSFIIIQFYILFKFNLFLNPCIISQKVFIFGLFPNFQESFNFTFYYWILN